MTSYRLIEQILPPPAPHMVGDGFRVHNFFPSGYQMDLARMSPFFLMDYGSKIEFGPADHQRGVGVHPHRGFETVTIAYHGRVAHHDSAGNSGVIGEGDVQWMTAGSGILHKEYHEKEFSKTGGMFQMVQLWVNLPAKYKMTPPKYQPVRREEMGTYILPGGGGTVEVIAGEFNGVKGPAATFTPIQMYNIRLSEGSRIEFDTTEIYNTGLMMIDGSADINGETAQPDHFVLFKNEGTAVKIKALTDTIILLLSGEPIRETIVPYGPFLMNTKQEILQAFDDLNTGKFGHLED